MMILVANNEQSLTKSIQQRDSSYRQTQSAHGISLDTVHYRLHLAKQVVRVELHTVHPCLYWYFWPLNGRNG